LRVPTFSTLELLGNAGFTGVEGALLAIALFSLPIPSPLSAILWLGLATVLVFAQTKRIIEKIDLLILIGITLAIVLLFPPLFAIVKVGEGRVGVLMLASFGGLMAIAITAIFRLIYKLLRNFL
jgi:hypothetical protein